MISCYVPCVPIALRALGYYMIIPIWFKGLLDVEGHMGPEQTGRHCPSAPFGAPIGARAGQGAFPLVQTFFFFKKKKFSNSFLFTYSSKKIILPVDS